MKATPYIQAIEDCIVLLNEIHYFIFSSGNIEYIFNQAEKPIREKLEDMLARLNDLKVEYYFQKDIKIKLDDGYECPNIDSNCPICNARKEPQIPTNFGDVKI